jgi:hypothetical protein
MSKPRDPDLPSEADVHVTGQDPLGYDTSDFMAYARQVVADALAGKNQDAVQEEIDRVSHLFPGKPQDDQDDPQGLGIAFAMIQTGFTEADVVSVLGYMPNLAITTAELDEMERRITAEYRRGEDDQ